MSKNAFLRAPTDSTSMAAPAKNAILTAGRAVVVPQRTASRAQIAKPTSRARRACLPVRTGPTQMEIKSARAATLAAPRVLGLLRLIVCHAPRTRLSYTMVLALLSVRLPTMPAAPHHARHVTLGAPRVVARRPPTVSRAQ